MKIEQRLYSHRKKIHKEAKLRDIVRYAFLKGIEWVEPAFGSSPGLPDVNIDIGGGVSIPVELKMWDNKFKSKSLSESAVVAMMRPAQIRYHIMGARKGKRSAILYSTPIPDSDELELFLLNGKHAPVDKLLHDVKSNSVLIGTSEHLPGSIRYFITKILNDEAFWA